MSFVLINKNGEVTTKKTRDLSFENLYKKCGFRSNNNFKRIHIWSVILNDETNLVAIYAKTKGRAGQENKYELPPPVDQDLYYGSLGVIRITSQGEIDNFTKEEWKNVYEALFGGFEDLSKTKHKDKDEDSELATEDDEANYDKSMITKTGYLKDDFILSDEDSDSDDENENEKDKEKDKETEYETDYEDSEEQNVILEDEYTDSELSEEDFTDDEEETI